MKTEERPRLSQLASPESVPKRATEQPHRLKHFFFTQQVFAILLCLFLILGGLMGYFSMVKEGYPDIQIARAMITTVWGGTDAETVENQITDKLEDKIKNVQGIQNITSASFNSFSVIDVEFKAEAPVAESIQSLRGKVDDAEPDLPPESEGREKTEFVQLSQQDAPVLTIAMSGEGLDAFILSQAAKDLQARLESVKNVREVNLGGQREEVIHIQMIPSRLTTLGISTTQVKRAIQDGNSDTSWDLVRDNNIGAQVRLYGRFRSLEDLRRLPVARLSDKRVVRLSEVANVYQGLERETNRVFLSWQGSDFTPAINLEVVKVAGSDTIQVIEDVLMEIESAKQEPEIWPYGLEYYIVNNDADDIRDELSNLGSNVFFASLCVFAVLVFALTWREALLAGLAIPLTFAGTLFILWAIGYTLNSMVMVGMILALGLLVDVFILMLEGMHEGIFVERLTFTQAALKTLSSYAGPAFSGQLTTILAMAPLMAISGTLGKFIRLIPISAIICLALSYVIALFVVIPFSKYLFGDIRGAHSKTFIDRLTEESSKKFAQWSLHVTVPNRLVARLWTLFTVGCLVVATILFTQLTVSLFPLDDGLKLSINVELPPAATLDRSQEVADKLGEKLRTYSEPSGEKVFETVTQLVGQRSNMVGSSELKPDRADYFVGFSAIFADKKQRQGESYEYIYDLRVELEEEILNDYPGAVLSLQYERAGGSDDSIQIELYGNDMQTLREISAQVQQALRDIPGTMDVRDDLGNVRKDYRLVPKRESLDFYGISQSDLGAQGRYLMIDNGIGNFTIGSGEEDLELRLSTQWSRPQGQIGGPSRLDEFAAIRFISPSEEALSVDALLELVRDVVPLSITHRNTERSVTVLAKNIPGSEFYDNEILAALKPKLETMQYDSTLSERENSLAGHWPQGYRYRFGGDSDTSGETFSSAGQMLIGSMFLVFAVLVLQFGSYTQPIIIMTTIPFALIGTFLGLFFLGLPFSFPTMIGVIALTGIVVNDAIVMVETMNERRKEGLDVRHAAAMGVSDRLRPILTTSITTIVGLLPLAFSDELWFPLCMTIIFGLVSATIIALLVVPGLYLLLTPTRLVEEESVVHQY